MNKMKAVQLDEQERLIIIDQTALPGRLIFTEVADLESLCDAIIRLKVRGAPAIGIAAAYGVYILARRYRQLQQPQFSARLAADIKTIGNTRPTAVNLSWALARMETVLRRCAQQPVAEIIAALKREAVAIDEEDAAISHAIAAWGAPLIKEGMGVLTHCNAGWLATSELGTALAPLYQAHSEGRRFRAYCDETRPLLQGARLTAYELMAAGIDTTLICDNMAASLMAAGKVDLIFVGADRIAANGDTANKIGTLSLAVNAAHFGVPFYVCAPSSTLDPATADGSGIIIEQRAPEEVTEAWYRERMAPPQVGVYNPAFDVTPHQLISGLITEDGIRRFND